VLFTSYVRRKQWEAKLQAGELLSLLVQGMGVDKKVRHGKAKARKLSPHELLAKDGG